MDLVLRQKDVAEMLGINEDTVRNWEANRVVPSGRLVKRVERFLTTKDTY
jgi:DNA-binding transcriptional regulator YiaG